MSYISYLQFCTGIYAPAEALDWLEKQLSDPPEFFGAGGYHFSRRAADRLQVWSEDEKLGHPLLLVQAVSEMQMLFDLKEPWYFTWSVTYDRPLNLVYRGGAAVCYKGAVTTLNIEKCAIDVINELLDAERTNLDHADSVSS